LKLTDLGYQAVDETGVMAEAGTAFEQDGRVAGPVERDELPPPGGGCVVGEGY
jgi:hypothetical protein